MTNTSPTVTAEQFRIRFPAMVSGIKPVVSTDLLDCIISVGESDDAIDVNGTFDSKLFQQLVEECMSAKTKSAEADRVLPLVYMAGVVTGMAISQYIMQ